MHRTLRRRVLQLGEFYLRLGFELHLLTAHAFQMSMSFPPNMLIMLFSANDGLRAMNLVASATH